MDMTDECVADDCVADDCVACEPVSRFPLSCTALSPLLLLPIIIITYLLFTPKISYPYTTCSNAREENEKPVYSVHTWCQGLLLGSNICIRWGTYVALLDAYSWLNIYPICETAWQKRVPKSDHLLGRFSGSLVTSIRRLENAMITHMELKNSP
jgi:hypothetical protein